MWPRLNVTLTDMVSDGEDKQIVDLDAIAREAQVKLEKDLADTKAWNDKIAQKKQQHADQKKEVERQHQEDVDKKVARLVVKEKADEATKKKGSVQPPVVSDVIFRKACRS